LTHHKKVLRLWRLPNIEAFTPNIETSKPQYWPIDVGSKKTTLDKAYEIK
jgi:hypothetical protein